MVCFDLNLHPLMHLLCSYYFFFICFCSYFVLFPAVEEVFGSLTVRLFVPFLRTSAASASHVSILLVFPTSPWSILEWYHIYLCRFWYAELFGHSPISERHHQGADIRVSLFYNFRFGHIYYIRACFYPFRFEFFTCVHVAGLTVYERVGPLRNFSIHYL